MKFFKSQHATAALAVTAVSPKDLKIDDPTNVKGVAKTLAAQAMSFYPGSAEQYVDLPRISDKGYYWWQMGAFTGAMMDYSYLTGDKSYDKIVRTALLAQRGKNNDFMSDKHADQMGNDDMAVWSLGVIAAAERNFAQISTTETDKVSSWLQLSINIFNNLKSRWDETKCGGGLFWQIHPENPNGVDYKNTIANGGLFQLAARLYRLTGEQQYADWANKIWDWTWQVKMIEHDTWIVVDGAAGKGKDGNANCQEVTKHGFTYTSGIYMYGAAVMANVTNNATWLDRADKILNSTIVRYTKTAEGQGQSGQVLSESACEDDGKGNNICNVDMTFHKGIASRCIWQAGLLVPSLKPQIDALMRSSAIAAASTCTGGVNGTACSQRWYLGVNQAAPEQLQGMYLGLSMTALEAVQGLLTHEHRPLGSADIKDVRIAP